MDTCVHCALCTLSLYTCMAVYYWLNRYIKYIIMLKSAICIILLWLYYDYYILLQWGLNNGIILIIVVETWNSLWCLYQAPFRNIFSYKPSFCGKTTQFECKLKLPSHMDTLRCTYMWYILKYIIYLITYSSYTYISTYHIDAAFG